MLLVLLYVWRLLPLLLLLLCMPIILYCCYTVTIAAATPAPATAMYCYCCCCSYKAQQQQTNQVFKYQMCCSVTIAAAIPAPATAVYCYCCCCCSYKAQQKQTNQVLSIKCIPWAVGLLATTGVSLAVTNSRSFCFSECPAAQVFVQSATTTANEWSVVRIKCIPWAVGLFAKTNVSLAERNSRSFCFWSAQQRAIGRQLGTRTWYDVMSWMWY